MMIGRSLFSTLYQASVLLWNGERKGRKCGACLGVEGARTDTGRISPGLHTHGRRRKGHDHATGVGFSPDRSTTKARLKLMRSLGVI